jgi:ubiquinol-cytochrome c reductase cytochrome b subunit
VPGLLIALIGVHLGLVVRQRHTQPRAALATPDRIVGPRAFPVYAGRAAGRFLLVTGILVGFGGLAQINPVWLYGPYEPALVSSNSQPDWYMFWLEGGLRLFPPWEIRAAGHSVPPVFWPGVVLPTMFFVLTACYPFMERRFTRDYGRYHVLQRPRDAPVRAAWGAFGMTFYAVLALTATDDLATHLFHLSIEPVVWAARVLNWALPVLAFVITHRVCRALARRERETAPEPPETGTFVRLPDGDYAEVVDRQPV